jgi:hypothetical protein
LVMGVLRIILLGLASNCDLPISASQVAKITGVNHWHLTRVI